MIRRLLRENPMGGSIRLTFEREPDYFRAADMADGEDQSVLVFSDSKLAAVGRCLRRRCWLDGEARSVGYLAELRLDAALKGRFGLLRDGYGFFHATQRENPADFYFTSIAEDNVRARRVLESGARGLPQYYYLSGLTTLLVAVPRSAKAPPFRTVVATADRVPELAHFLNQHARRHQLAAVWSEDMLHGLARHGLPLHRFLLVLDAGQIVACGALWDQRAFRQTVIRSYSKPLAFVRPLVNLASSIFGMPRLPQIDTALSHAFLSPVAFAEGREEMLSGLLASFFSMAAGLGLEFVTLGIPSEDGRCHVLQRSFHTRSWPCRLYRVSWPDSPGLAVEQKGTPFLPDIALL